MRMKREYKLWQLDEWDAKTIKTFSELILSYQATPSTKRLVNSMIKFEEMYNPLVPGPFHVDIFNLIDGQNEYRKGLRTKIYLHKKDLIKTVDEKGGKKLVLTTRGHKIFYQEYPLAKLRSKKWDGFWTIINYDFPNLQKTDRDYFRRKLKGLGFGSPQESVYVSPLPLSEALNELVEGERFENFVWVVRAERVLGLNNREVAKKSWNLQNLNDLYKNLLNVLPRVKKINDVKLTQDWRLHFLAVDNNDPYLPRELLPEDYKADACKKAFARLGLPGLLKTIFG